MAGSDLSWKAGARASVITPGEPMWLAGWAARTAPARGRLGDLYARALALEDPQGARLVLLALDLIAVPVELASAVAALVHRRHALPRERLVVAATHTHCGPEVRPDKVRFFGIPPEHAAKIPAYVERLTDQLAELVGAALGAMEPARLVARRTGAPFAHNRRGADVVDREVPILDITGRSGQRLAVVFGYACHNTTLPPDDLRYCGDYAGFAQAELEGSGQALVALFLAGAGADQDPEPRGSLELARRHGRALAEAVAQSLADPGASSARAVEGTLGVAFAEVPLDFQPLPPRAELEAAAAASDGGPARVKARFLLEQLDRGEPIPSSYPCPVHAARFGRALLLVALGGEPVVDYARQIKERLGGGGRFVWVAGYANDMFGYVPSARVLREGGYEGGRSLYWSALPAPFAEDTELRILDAIDRLVQALDQED